MTDIMETIKGEVENNPILLYIKGEKEMPMCGFSNQVIQVFKHLGVPFETRNVLESDERRAALKEFTNWPTFPQVYIAGEFVGGCDITMELFQNGELKEMVEKVAA